MGATAQLTPGAVKAIVDGTLPAAIQPVLQVVEPRLVTTTRSANPSERYRLVLSDGVNAQQAMLATALNAFVTDGTLRTGAIVHLNEFICSTIQGKRIIIVVKLEILQIECAIIGSPKNYVVQSPAKVQDPNLSSIGAQNNTEIYSGGPGVLGSVVAPRAEQASNNLSYGGPYDGAQGMLGSSIGQSVEPDHSNVFTGGSYGTLSAQNTITANVVEPRSQQPSLISHQDQGLAISGTGEALSPPANIYRTPKQPTYQQPPPIYINRAPAARNESTPCVVPITALNLYQTRWTIKARVTAKTSVKHWNNAKSTGKLFSFDLLDGEGGEIRAICFRGAVDQFYDLIEVNKVYLISRGTVRPARKQFNPLSNDHEIILDASLSSVEICSGDDYNIPKVQYNFCQISEIENMDKGTIIDLLGVVASIGPSVVVMRKDGTKTQKRTLQLRDMSDRSVEVTFWGNFCDVEGQQLQLQCDSGYPILALIGACVSDFSGRSVSTIRSTQLKINPVFPDTERLRQWYITEGKATACVSLSREQFNSVCVDVRKTIARIKDEYLGRDKPDWITVKAAISHVQTDYFCYPACPLIFNEKPCSKKVVDNGNGMWLCERCNKSFENCELRYMVRFQIQDHTGSIDVTAFHEAGEQIFGRSAQELHTIRNVDHDDAFFTEIIEGARWHLNLFKLEVRVESFNDKPRVKCSIVNAEKVDPTKESYILLKTIDSHLQGRSRPSPGDQCNIPTNTGFSNSHNALTSNNACDLNLGGTNQFGQEGSIGGRISSPSAGMDRQQQPTSGGFIGNNNAYDMNLGGANQFGKEGSICGGISSPSAGMDRQQQPPSGGFIGNNNAYDMNLGGANQFGHEENICGRISTPSAGMSMNRQQQPPGGGSTGNGYDSAASNRSASGCFTGGNFCCW